MYCALASIAVRCRSRVDLRFLDEKQESSFKSSVERQLVRCVVFASVWAAAANILHLTHVYSEEVTREGSCFQHSFDDPRTVYFLVLAFIIFVSTAIASSASLHLCLGYSCFVDWEAITLLYTCLIAVCYTFGSKWGVAALWSVESVDIWLDADIEREPATALFMCFLVSAVCKLFPIRTHRLWILTIAACAPYVVLNKLGTQPLFTSFSFDATLVSLCLFAYWGAVQYEQHIRQEWRIRQDLHQSQGIVNQQRNDFYAAVFKLLTWLCDCVVHLGDGLEIVEACPKLGAFIFHSDWKALEGVSFTNFIASPEDKENFTNSLRRSALNLADDESDKGLLHLRFRDTHDREFRVHVCYASFISVDGQPHHILGITEPEERVHLDAVGELQAFQQHGGTNRSSDGIDDVLLPPDAGEGPMNFTFDAFTFDVTKCSEGFVAVCGPCPTGVNLMDWLGDDDDFIAKYSSFGNQLLNNENSHDDMRLTGHMVLRPPFLTSVGTEVLAEYHITLTESEDVEGVIAHAELLKVCKRLHTCQDSASSGSSAKSKRRSNVSGGKNKEQLRDHSKGTPRIVEASNFGKTRL